MNRSALMPSAAALLVAAALAESGTRVLLALAAPLVVFALLAQRLPRAAFAIFATLDGVLALGGGVIARSVVAAAGGVLFLASGLPRAWGVNRHRTRSRAWASRLLTVLGALLLSFFVVLPALVTVDFLAKPRQPIDDGSLGLAHERVRFAASDGVDLSGWYVPSRNGAAIVLVHGGGGDREGAILHARMLARAGYGVLLYDARGRGESAGHENAAGWEWDSDVRGAVSYLAAHGIHRIGSLGLSTGAEAVVVEAATDPRVGAVVADGLQGRTAEDASRLSAGDRVSVEPSFAVAGALMRLVRGESAPPPLVDAVHTVAASRPLLLIGTIPVEREWDRSYVKGTKAMLWELPGTQHTKGLADHRRAYAARVLSVFDTALSR
jgi:uncharacterized protein